MPLTGQSQIMGSNQRTLNDNSMQYDPSNFPTLSAVNSSVQNNSQQHVSRINNMMNSSMLGRENDFTIASEDFPALPGSNQNSVSGPNNLGLGMKQDPSLIGSGQLNSFSSPPQSSTNLGSASSDILNGTLPSSNIYQQMYSVSAINGTATGTGTGNSGTGSSISRVVSNPTPSHGSSVQFQGHNQGMTGGIGALDMSSSSSVVSGVTSAMSNQTALTKDAKYGLVGLLDVIRMTDKVRIQ
jgi:hypothetical protein